MISLVSIFLWSQSLREYCFRFLFYSNQMCQGRYQGDAENLINYHQNKAKVQELEKDQGQIHEWLVLA